MMNLRFFETSIKGHIQKRLVLVRLCIQFEVCLNWKSVKWKIVSDEIFVLKLFLFNRKFVSGEENLC